MKSWFKPDGFVCHVADRLDSLTTRKVVWWIAVGVSIVLALRFGKFLLP